ncbi:MAG: hypothetical protein EWV63_02585 [Microcystis aeruginosa Ma_OC_H_19870700_S124]|uniref:Uncharacterized protein n=1 Tax=Microcystis aeruginosa Ma_OC_H_19870700_S124 TaxID=2486262 RepID=A0A552AWV1_MICAE|nr:MAG: hypothetical protein EWV63_02585 [Microcystis aeruginosa Ma_OC_H_19870700_S124]
MGRIKLPFAFCLLPFAFCLLPPVSCLLSPDDRLLNLEENINFRSPGDFQPVLGFNVVIGG